MRVLSPHFATLVLLLVSAGLAVGASPAAADTAGNVSLYDVPEDVDGPDDLPAAVDDGDADTAGTVVAGDRIAVVVDSERLAADLENRNGTTTERFFAALQGDADLRVVQTNPPASRVRKVVRLQSGDATVHRNGSAVYVLVDTGELTFERPRSSGNEEVPLADGDQFAVTFGYNLSQFAADGPEIELYTAHSEFVDGPTHIYDPLPPEVVNRSVRVNVEPEERLVARLALEDGGNVTAPVEPVEGASNHRVTLDLRDVEPGTGYELSLVHDGEVVDRYEGTVREPTASVTNVTVTEIDNWTAVNATANLSHGGEVRVLNEDDERLGWTSVPPGNRTDVSIRLRGSADELVVRAARETGASEEFYAGTTTTIDFSERELRDPLATETPTPTDSPAETARELGNEADTATATGTGTGSGTGSDADGGASPTDDQPGFGAGVAVTALLAVALLARRRA